MIAVRGLVDVDGSITGDLNGTVVNTDVQAPFIIRGPIVPGNFLGTGTPALFTDDHAVRHTTATVLWAVALMQPKDRGAWSPLSAVFCPLKGRP